MGEKFRARFKIKYGIDDNEAKDQEYKDVIVDYDRLRATKLKPEYTFRWKKGSYIYNPKAIKEYDSKGRPILKYYVGNSIAIIEEPDKEPTVKDEDGKEVKVSAYIYDETFAQGQMKSIIASSQKEPQKFDWMTIIIGVVMGTPLGIIIGVLLAVHGYI